MKNSSSKYSYNDAPICPWCDHENEEWQGDAFASRDGSTVETGCANCGKKYSATIHVEYSFSTEAIGCKPHRLESFHRIYKRYECSQCHNQYYSFDLADGEFPKLKPDEYVIGDENDR